MSTRKYSVDVNFEVMAKDDEEAYAAIWGFIHDLMSSRSKISKIRGSGKILDDWFVNNPVEDMDYYGDDD